MGAVEPGIPLFDLHDSVTNFGAEGWNLVIPPTFDFGSSLRYGLM